MGLPIDRLIVATNENDILHRFFTEGKYHKLDCRQTISPSMDISVSSNFERYLFDLCGKNSDTLKQWMQEFETTGRLTLTGDLLANAKQDFMSARASETQIFDIMKEYHEEHQYTLCPHSAVGVSAIKQLGMENVEVVCLATAHHAKFPEATSKVIKTLEEPPSQLAELEYLPTRTVPLPNSTKAIKQYIESLLGGVVDPSESIVVAWLKRTPSFVYTAGAVVGVSILVSLYILKGRR